MEHRKGGNHFMIDKVNETHDTMSLNMAGTWQDNITIKGEVTLRVRDEHGNVIQTFNHNQVVYLGRHRMSRVLCGDSGVGSSEKVLNTIKLAGGAVPSGGDAMNPTAVSATDTGLFETTPANIYSTVLPAASFNAVAGTTLPTATFTITLTSALVNRLVNEAGIFFGSTGPIFAHYSFPTIDLRNTSNNSLEIVWQFSF